jgi:myo-inositol-1(or 4)-monophosphatase
MSVTCPEFDVAVAAAQAAGELLARMFRRGMEAKGKDPGATYNLVSEADVAAERAIVAVIRSAFPRHAILGEELHRDDIGAAELWIVDPLDGTTNFVHGIPHFAVSIAYYDQGRARCGIVYNPITGERFEAIRGAGARRSGERIGVASHNSLDESLVGVGFYYDRGAMMEATLLAIRDLFRRHIHGIRRFGTASLDLAQVAAGHYGAYFEYELAPWDFAAGRLLVEEAGGTVTTCQGAALPLARTSLLASNGRLHQAMLETVQPHLPSAAPPRPL